MNYKERLLFLLSDESNIKWKDIEDVYGNNPRDFFISMIETEDHDQQDDLCHDLFAGMFHQEIAEPELPQMMEPLLLTCTLPNISEQVKANVLGTLDYISEQGLTLAGYIGHMLMRMGFYEIEKPPIEMKCIQELRKHKDIIYYHNSPLCFTIAESGDCDALLSFALRQIESDEYRNQTLLNCTMFDFAYNGGLVKALLNNTNHEFDTKYLAVAKRTGGIELNTDEQEIFHQLITTHQKEVLWTTNYALLTVYKESGFDWRSVAPYIKAQKESYAPVAEKAQLIENSYSERRMDFYSKRSQAVKGLTGEEYSNVMDEWDKRYNAWEEQQKKYEELEIIGAYEWPTFQAISEYLVMDAFRDNLGTGVKLDTLTDDQQALMDFLKENGIDTYMERSAGVTTDKD